MNSLTFVHTRSSHDQQLVRLPSIKNLIKGPQQSAPSVRSPTNHRDIVQSTKRSTDDRLGRLLTGTAYDDDEIFALVFLVHNYRLSWSKLATTMNKLFPPGTKRMSNNARARRCTNHYRWRTGGAVQCRYSRLRAALTAGTDGDVWATLEDLMRKFILDMMQDARISKEVVRRCIVADLSFNLVLKPETQKLLVRDDERAQD